ncbi:MAG TPA: prenyltransferase/squalene oxidase repeat-containing protein, partial [Fimbriiglobus sp.]|nr:prenyltransferase/squalene oxidase repeat-containing protein [Fimbriiglobus sp.]
MTALLRPLAAVAAVLGVATLGALALTDDPKPPPRPAADAEKPLDVDKIKPGKPAEWKCAVAPRPLSEAVKKGLKWLAERQNADGGWSQGGGWRTGGQNGGRVEGKEVADPSDVGNTCMVLLALYRAGNTPTEGDYKAHVQKGLKYLFEQVEKAKADDLYVTDVRNTQLQSKIGPFVDTFLTTLVLSELKGKVGEQEKSLAAALDKTIGKIAKHQKEDGTFAGNGGWAPVLSQGVCNKALGRARLNGVKFSDELIARAGRQSQAAANGTATAPAAGERVALGAIAVRPAGKPGAAALPAVSAAPVDGFAARGLGGGVGDAGVPLYSGSQAAGNLQDVLNTVNVDADKAKKVIADPKATREAKTEAEKTIKKAEELAKDANEARTRVVAQARQAQFVAGAGSNGGEEFLSFLNIGEMLVIKGGKDWTDWDGKMREM